MFAVSWLTALVGGGCFILVSMSVMLVVALCVNSSRLTRQEEARGVLEGAGERGQASTALMTGVLFLLVGGLTVAGLASPMAYWWVALAAAPWVVAGVVLLVRGGEVV